MYQPEIHDLKTKDEKSKTVSCFITSIVWIFLILATITCIVLSILAFAPGVAIAEEVKYEMTRVIFVLSILCFVFFFSWLFLTEEGHFVIEEAKGYGKLPFVKRWFQISIGIIIIATLSAFIIFPPQ